MPEGSQPSAVLESIPENVSVSIKYCTRVTASLSGSIVSINDYNFANIDKAILNKLTYCLALLVHRPLFFRRCHVYSFA
jgi:hypothetical protein